MQQRQNAKYFDFKLFTRLKCMLCLQLPMRATNNASGERFLGKCTTFKYNDANVNLRFLRNNGVIARTCMLKNNVDKLRFIILT